MPSLDRNHPLDNVAWSALTTAHAGFAAGDDLARRYPDDMAPFAAIREPSAAAYAALAALLPPGREARLFRPNEEATPLGWETLSARPIIQMVADAPIADDGMSDDLSVRTLAIADADDMLALAEIAKPGPFSARTVLLGGYLGLRDAGGQLIAMAGERFRLPGHAEMSAICSHPDARGRGFGRMLTVNLARRIQARGAVPFLHVFPDNPAAALYTRLGFRERSRPWVVWRRPSA